MEKRKKLEFRGRKLYINVYQYENDRIAILLDTIRGEYYADITINLPELNIDKKTTVFINSHATSCGLEESLKEIGIIQEILGKQRYNMGTYTRATIDIEKLREYDPEGVKEYIK